MKYCKLYFLQVIFVLWTIQQQQGCERAVVDSGGTVLRLGGLYHLRRGAHNYWVCSGKSPFASSPDGLINLIHYDDAAEAVLCALKEKPCGGEGKKRQLYLVTDGVPISRKEIWYKKTIDLLCARSGKLVHAFLSAALLPGGTPPSPPSPSQSSRALDWTERGTSCPEPRRN